MFTTENAKERRAVKATLLRLLGELPPPIVPQVELVHREERDGYSVEKFAFHNSDPIGGTGARVLGYLLIPHGLTVPAPAVVYHHWHGGEYDLGKEELWRKNSRGNVIAEEFVKRGYILLSIDAYGFGERSGKGPSGEKERGSAEEMSLSKLNLWYGRTLWGMMLRDESLALDYLCTRLEVDSTRIASVGISMGSTRAWWRMALDERIKVGVGVACLTRYQDLIAHRALSAHGIYFFVPGMLRHFDMEAVVSLCAPRPLLLMNGDSDTGTPPDGVHKINAVVSEVYRNHNAAERYRSLIFPKTGHEWTPAMWEETITWLARWL